MPHIEVYRIADAPQWACDVAIMAQDNDPVAIFSKDASVEIAALAARLVSLYCFHALQRGEIIRPIEGVVEDRVVYTVARGVQ